MNRPSIRKFLIPALWLVATVFGMGCKSTSSIGQLEPRQGDEIVAAGQFFHTGTRVVLWMDPGGYDGYRVEERFEPWEKSDWETAHTNHPDLISPNRYSERLTGLSSNEVEQVRGGGWNLPLLQRVVDQFVIHYDDAGTSQKCFKILQDDRGLSVHFLLDLDGTIYQTLDLKERARHATSSNNRSIGVEIANVGAFPPDEPSPLDTWYKTNSDGQTIITLPPNLGDGGVHTKNFVGHPIRNGLVSGNIQGVDLVQYDYTPQQYAALIRLTAAVCKIFPKIQCRYPVDDGGRLITHKMSDDQLREYEGVLGHYHIQTNKLDPGPAFQWDRVIDGARKLMGDPKPLASKALLSPRTKINARQ